MSRREQCEIDEMRLVGQGAIVDRQADRERDHADDDRVHLVVGSRQPPVVL